MISGSLAARPTAAAWRRWSPVATGTAAATVTALMTGIPTDVVPNPWFMRMTPSPWWAFPVLLASAALSGVMVALMRARPTPSACSRLTGGVAGVAATSAWLALGCPVCNKLVVLILGFSGALTWFAPVQPLLALTALAALLAGVSLQWRTVRARTPMASGGLQ